MLSDIFILNGAHEGNRRPHLENPCSLPKNVSAFSLKTSYISHILSVIRPLRYSPHPNKPPKYTNPNKHSENKEQK